MKTLVVLVSILFCMAISNANAQSVSTKEIWPGTFYYECGGVLDAISGPITFHWVTNYGKDGNVVWKKLQMHSAELVSEATDEVFRMSQEQKQDAWGMPGSQQAWHFNLIGDLGSHVLVTVVVDISVGWKVIEYKVKCL